jgi:hypothetical protein
MNIKLKFVHAISHIYVENGVVGTSKADMAGERTRLGKTSCFVLGIEPFLYIKKT